MKNLFYLISLLFITSCGDGNEEITTDANEKEELVEKTKEELLMRRWMFKEITSSDGEKSFSYDGSSSDVVLRIDKNGYFIIYDSITDLTITDKGIKRIEQRSAGQWQLINGDLLLLKKIFNDTIITDSLIIKELNDTKLVTASDSKKKITYFSID